MAPRENNIRRVLILGKGLDLRLVASVSDASEIEQVLKDTTKRRPVGPLHRRRAGNAHALVYYTILYYTDTNTNSNAHALVLTRQKFIHIHQSIFTVSNSKLVCCILHNWCTWILHG